MVQTVPGNTWIDGGEENVAVAKTIHYTADEVKAGDYIYSGRSTSDGGLRKRYPNRKDQVIADPKRARRSPVSSSVYRKTLTPQAD